MAADTIMGPVHPGEILLEEFLRPLGVSQYQLAKEIAVPARRINEIVHGQRRVSVDTALTRTCRVATAQFRAAPTSAAARAQIIQYFRLSPAALGDSCFRMVRMTTPSPSAFDPQAFEGTAGYYAVGRPAYSAELADTMARELSLDGTGQLLDVGCGPGVLELALARLFDQVTALDPEPGMLAAGQRRCQQAGVASVRWLQGVAEDIAALNLGPQRAVTFGQSFHRVRRLEVAEAVYDLLVPGGSLILISHNADDGRPRPAGPGHPGVPHAAVQELILHYLGDGTRHYLATWNQGQPARFEDTLSQTRFGGSRTIWAPGRPDLIKDIDTVVASYFSLSYAAPRWFGNRRADFESSLRHLLREYSPDGLFWDWPGDTELVMATKS